MIEKRREWVLREEPRASDGEYNDSSDSYLSAIIATVVHYEYGI